MCLYGSDTMWAQGWPDILPDTLEDFTEGQKQKLAGKAFALPCAAMVQAALYWNPQAPFWHECT